MKSKIVGLFAAVLMALVVVGLAYAHWSQTIYIEGTVETGTVCVGWLSATAVEYEDKDVGNIEVSLDEMKGSHGEDPIYERLIISLENVYPGYIADLTVEIANGGSIPVDLVRFDLDAVSDPEGLLQFVSWSIVNYDWPGYPQIDPCEVVTITIRIVILQEIEGVTCPQGASATFAGELVFNQWNTQ